MSSSETPEDVRRRVEELADNSPLTAEQIAANATSDRTEPDYYLDAQDMVRILGIPAPTFQQWCKRGLMPALIVQHKGRTYRRFTLNDCWRAATMAVFYRQGFEPKQCSELAALVEEAYHWVLERAHILPGEPLNVHVAVSLSNRKWAVITPTETIPEIVRHLDVNAFVVIDLDGVRRELHNATVGASRAYQSKEKPTEA